MDCRAAVQEKQRRRGEAVREREECERSTSSKLDALAAEARALTAELECIARTMERAPTKAEVEKAKAAAAAEEAKQRQQQQAEEEAVEDDSLSQDDVGGIDWPHRGWTYAAEQRRRAGGCGVRAVEVEGMGKCITAERDFAVGELILGDTSVLDVASSLDDNLLTGSTLRFAHGFLAAARAGEARSTKSVNTKELEPGIVLMSQKPKTGRDAEQGFDLSPVAVTGVNFTHGLLPVVMKFAELAHDDPEHPCWKVFDMFCPLRDVPETIARRFVNLGNELLRAMHTRLSAHANVLTPDRVAKLLLIVQCNSIAVRRGQYRGVAVFPLASLMEHSCEPNAIAAVLDETADFGESMLEVRALRPIARGEAISIDYLGGLALPTTQRRAMLQASHFFTCQCDRCVDQADKARTFWSGERAERGSDVARNPEEADALLDAACKRVMERITFPSVVCPIGDGESEWFSYVDSKKVAADSFAGVTLCQRLLQGEEGVSKVAAPAVQAAAGGDWSALDRLLCHPTVHPTHHLVVAAAGDGLLAAYRVTGELTRCLSLLATVVDGHVWVRGAAAVEQVAELREVAAQAWTRSGNPSRAAAHREAVCVLLRHFGLENSVRGVDSANRLRWGGGSERQHRPPAAP
eukprot:Hpha_TRINITY_DN15800_c6_g11::TRINITY_DN15800_c6_g11_i1::g.187028::m.187028